ncbi:MAG: hypothetical protein EAZ85_02445 [Bacteroidetes bacterium]|nr:MAG: hypothetical protein EAZ85_02445 [Bacteroidota bacterium]TAG90303.1 MAG: hypothetical protein EAZ20_04765 [Bacteroidota bacterium]
MFDKIIEKGYDLFIDIVAFVTDLITTHGWYAAPILLGIFLVIRFALKMLFLYLRAINPLTGRIARVARVSDGDTFIIGHHKKKYRREKVRLIGIDTPESVRSMYMDVMPFGKEASDYTKKRLYEGRRVILIFDQAKRDEFGRLLAYVYLLTGEFYNATLVKKGYAFAEKYPPNIRFSNKFERLESNAKFANRGIWKIYKNKKEVRNEYKRTEHYKNFLKTKSNSSNNW